MKIGKFPIGPSHPPFVIAEMSGNHNQSLARALALVDAAASSGAHALKLQTYTPDSMTLNIDGEDFVIRDPASPWNGERLYELYQKAATPWEWHEQIMRKATSLGMICFSSPFDAAAVDFLEGLDVPAYKIASFECVDLPLIKRVAKTGKPLIISTGMATLSEIAEAVETARQAGCRDLALLKCTSTYPASPSNTNLWTIPAMRDAFRCEVGLSDHTQGIGAAVAAVALGATVIEKHLTLRRAEGGVDAEFSLEPDELMCLVNETHQAWQAVGTVLFGPTEAELGARQRRRSLYVSKDMKAGEVLSEDSVKSIRPGKGLPPKYLAAVLGRRVRQDVKKGTPLAWHLLA